MCSYLDIHRDAAEQVWSNLEWEHK
jgi:hypothetical protein